MGKVEFFGKMIFVSFFLMTAYNLVQEKKYTENLIKSYKNYAKYHKDVK